MHTLSVIIPCFNEESTLQRCIDRVLEIESADLSLQIIIVDDCSKDRSYEIACHLQDMYPSIEVLRHDVNKGKGAALRTGFRHATSEFVIVQDADLEYNPREIPRLLQPLINGTADVVFGSRFMTSEARRVLYYWHSMGNKFLTAVSNMFSDVNLTDMATCYKAFKREVIQDIEIEENRFGFEPEITAKVAQKRCRIYEIGISYEGRTYEEGKKIGWKDGIRVLYCIFRYNAHMAPLPIQLLIYLFVGGTSAIVNLIVFLVLFQAGVSVNIAAPVAFVVAAIFNYYLSTAILFKRNIRWNTTTVIIMYTLVVLTVAGLDLLTTKYLIVLGVSASLAKITATLIGFLLNFLGRAYIVFPHKRLGDWKKQLVKSNKTEKES